MGIFSDAVGKLDGEPAAVFAFSRDWKKYAEEVAEIRVSCLDAGSLAPRWAGESRDSFERGVQTESDDLSTISNGANEAANALSVYGWALDGYKKSVADLKASNDALDAEYEGLDPAVQLVSYPFFQMEADRNKASFESYVEQAKGAATECAARLREALHIEAGVPDGNDRGKRSDLSPEQIEAINAQVASGNMSYEDIHQHGIGDCYYLSTIMALTKSPEGRRIIQDSIKVHYGPDGKPDGFMVTVYDDPLHPDAKASRTVFVDDVYGKGVTGPDGKPNYASILESAYGQQHPGGALDSGKDNGISGGSRNQAAQDLTNNSAEEVYGSSGYSSSERKEIIDAANSSNPVTAGTGSAPPENFPNDGKAEVGVTLPSGEKTNIELYHGHAYMVVDADQNGVTLANPHGHNNDQTGREVDGTFTMSWEDYEKYYGSTTIGNVK